MRHGTDRSAFRGQYFLSCPFIYVFLVATVTLLVLSACQKKTINPPGEMTGDPQANASVQPSVRHEGSTSGREKEKLPTSTAVQPPEPNLEQVAPSFKFLAWQQDIFHQVIPVYTDQDSGANSFYPAFMGDFEKILTDNVACLSCSIPANPLMPTAQVWGTFVQLALAETMIADIYDDGFKTNPRKGTTCIRFSYPRQLAEGGGEGWAGIYWLFPEGNWGSQGGHDLRRYKGKITRLVFSARGEKGGEFVEFKLGGVNCPPHNDPTKPYRDSFGPLTPASKVTKLQRTWQEFEIPLRGLHVESLIGGFCVVASRAYNPAGCRIYVDEVRLELSEEGKTIRLAEPRFIRSYLPPLPGNPDRYFRNVCFHYDQALALLAFLARGDKDDMRRAKLLADAFLYAQNHDRFYRGCLFDGRIRTGSSCGDLYYRVVGETFFPTRFSGWWNPVARRWEEDEYCLGTDCGNLAWVIIALVSYWEKSGGPANSPYLAAADKLGTWIETNCRSEKGPGGYTGGLEGFDGKQRKSGWKSTEHNIDLYVAFERLQKATGKPVWGTRAEHARKFVEKMWNGPGNHLWTGTRPDGTTQNEEVIPLDIHPWALLAFRSQEPYAWGIDWALANCLVKRCPVDHKSMGFDFNPDRDGVWWEGTGQMVLALRFLRRDKEAQRYLTALRAGAEEVVPRGAIMASSRDRLSTGFTKDWGPWVYYRRPHVGATCWYIFAELGWNPYWGVPVSTTQARHGIP
jgi:hypothetical protein